MIEDWTSAAVAGLMGANGCTWEGVSMQDLLLYGGDTSADL